MAPRAHDLSRAVATAARPDSARRAAVVVWLPGGWAVACVLRALGGPDPCGPAGAGGRERLVALRGRGGDR